ncbi:MAG: hypothetical protein IJT77_11390 [Clostridia bacterium]|nr:hypothetical protein [Clostridia bacterium]
MTEPVRTREMLLELVNEMGILPFFKNSIPGWSLEEHIDPAVWFTSENGPWEWKGQLAANKSCVYSKLVRNGNAWVSLSLFPDLANYRRDGYDFEGRIEDGLVPYRDRLLMEYLESHIPVLSRVARRSCGFTKGYETSLTRLEMQTFVINQDFVYDLTKSGKPYGWGNAFLTFPEKWFGEDYLDKTDGRTPEESLTHICETLHRAMSDIQADDFRRMLK